MDSTQTEKKSRNGDFYTLAKMLGCSYGAARMRFNRDIKNKRFSRKNEEAKELMAKIIEVRESLISQHNTK